MIEINLKEFNLIFNIQCDKILLSKKEKPMKKIFDFFRNIFCGKELTAEEEREMITKLVEKIKEI